MKAFRTIQIVASAIGIIIALRCVDSLTPTTNELMGGMALVVTSCIGLIGQRYYQEQDS